MLHSCLILRHLLIFSVVWLTRVTGSTFCAVLAYIISESLFVISVNLYFFLRPDRSPPVHYAETSMKNGFGLKYIHKFLNLPFLLLQVSNKLPVITIFLVCTFITVYTPLWNVTTFPPFDFDFAVFFWWTERNFAQTVASQCRRHRGISTYYFNSNWSYFCKISLQCFSFNLWMNDRKIVLSSKNPLLLF